MPPPSPGESSLDSPEKYRWETQNDDFNGKSWSFMKGSDITQIPTSQYVCVGMCLRVHKYMYVSIRKVLIDLKLILLKRKTIILMLKLVAFMYFPSEILH